MLIVGRGGGSIEDLWAFNDERVAYAIYNSNIPVISAVGHEPDVTISDFVADLRAATPSNAAELAVPDQDSLRQTLDSMAAAMISVLQRQIKSARRHLNILAASPGMQSPVSYMEHRRKALAILDTRLISAQKQTISRNKQRYVAYTAKLDAMSPLKVLTRGYAMAQARDKTIVRSVKQVSIGDDIKIILSDGTLNATIVDTKEQII